MCIVCIICIVKKGDSIMSTATVRKNITLPVTTYETINTYAKKCGKSFSEFLRDTALNAVTKSENLDLLEYLNANCAYVDSAEQAEIEALNIDFNDLSGREITLDELLQG